MYILRESRQNEADGQKISGQYHLIGYAFHVSLKYFDLNTENPQGRITINGLEMESQPYTDAEAEFQQITDAAVAECKATKHSFLNLSDIETFEIEKPKPRRKQRRRKPETPTETEAS